MTLKLPALPENFLTFRDEDGTILAIEEINGVVHRYDCTPTNNGRSQELFSGRSETLPTLQETL